MSGEMLGLLKELGSVCENKLTGVGIKNHHKEMYEQLGEFYGERHLKEFHWWGKQITDMNKHIEQLHKQIKAI